jgi:hypothetical protein
MKDHTNFASSVRGGTAVFEPIIDMCLGTFTTCRPVCLSSYHGSASSSLQRYNFFVLFLKQHLFFKQKIFAIVDEM